MPTAERKSLRLYPMKVWVDRIGAGFGLILLSPLLLLVALAVWISLGRPILFRQVRPGLHGESFVLYKFRTMREERKRDGPRLKDTERMTRVGRWLRITSLDELPALLNVLEGDMSLVGPRPLLTGYLDLYSPEQARRHEVKPGITGWAQVNGRNAISWEQKFELDLWYVDNASLMVDLKILLLTIQKVLRREGIDLGPIGRFEGSQKDSGSGEK